MSNNDIDSIFNIIAGFLMGEIEDTRKRLDMNRIEQEKVVELKDGRLVTVLYWFQNQDAVRVKFENGFMTTISKNQIKGEK